MNITPEDQFEKDIWWILQRIKSASLRSLKSKPVRYRFSHGIGMGNPDIAGQKDLLLLLKEQKVLKLVEEIRRNSLCVDLNLLPKFNIIYKKYQTNFQDNTIEDRNRKIQAKKLPDDCEQLREWPDNFDWEEEKHTFRVGEHGTIPFNKDSNRHKIFKMLTEAKGNWVYVKKMAKEVDIPRKDVRTTINHINNRLKVHKNKLIQYLEIIPKKGRDGAYRIKIISAD